MRVGVVLAVREYQAWLIASARALRKVGGLSADLEPPPNPEQLAGAKGWLAQRMPHRYSGTVDYSETVDQSAPKAEMPSTSPPRPGARRIGARRSGACGIGACVVIRTAQSSRAPGLRARPSFR